MWEQQPGGTDAQTDGKDVDRRYRQQEFNSAKFAESTVVVMSVMTVASVLSKSPCTVKSS